MLIAILVTVVLVISATWLISLHSINQTLQNINKSTTPDPELSRAPAEFVTGSYDIRPSKYRNQAGFGGLNGYSVTRYWFAAGKRQDSPVSPFGPDLPPAIAHESHPFSSTTVNEGDSYGLPPPETFFEIVPSYNWGTSIGISNSDLTKSSGQDSPPLIRLAEVRYPRKGLFINGIVRVAFTISANGNIEDYELEYEVPQGHEFAVALKEAINESIFFPGTIAGKRSSSRILLTYEFCWNCSKPMGVRISEGVIVAGKPF